MDLSSCWRIRHVPPRLDPSDPCRTSPKGASAALGTSLDAAKAPSKALLGLLRDELKVPVGQTDAVAVGRTWGKIGAMKRLRLWDDEYSIHAEGDFTVEFHHEAGHVVAAWCLGVGLDRVERRPYGSGDVAMMTYLEPALSTILQTQPKAGLVFLAAGTAASQTLISEGQGADFTDGAGSMDALIWVDHAPDVNGDQVISGDAQARFDNAVEHLTDWVRAHEPQINRVAELFWEEFIDHSISSPQQVAEVVRAGVLRREDLTARLGAETCPEPSCVLSGLVAGEQ